MKKKEFLLAIVFVVSINLYAYSQCDTAITEQRQSLRNHLLSMDYSKYSQKKLFLFLKNDTLNQYCLYNIIGNYPGCLPGVSLIYNNYAIMLKCYFIQECPNDKLFKTNGKWNKKKIKRRAIIKNIEIVDLTE